MYFLQNRWKLEKGGLYYYGLRNKGDLFHNKVKLSPRQQHIVASLPKELDEQERKILGKLLGTQIVTKENLKVIPKTLVGGHLL